MNIIIYLFSLFPLLGVVTPTSCKVVDHNVELDKTLEQDDDATESQPLTIENGNFVENSSGEEVKVAEDGTTEKGTVKDNTTETEDDLDAELGACAAEPVGEDDIDFQELIALRASVCQSDMSEFDLNEVKSQVRF